MPKTPLWMPVCPVAGLYLVHKTERADGNVRGMEGLSMFPPKGSTQEWTVGRKRSPTPHQTLTGSHQPCPVGPLAWEKACWEGEEGTVGDGGDAAGLWCPEDSWAKVQFVVSVEKRAGRLHVSSFNDVRVTERSYHNVDSKNICAASKMVSHVQSTLWERMRMFGLVSESGYFNNPIGKLHNYI